MSTTFRLLLSAYLLTCAMRIMASLRYDTEVEGVWGATFYCSSIMNFIMESAISHEALVLGLLAHFFSYGDSRGHMRAFKGVFVFWRGLGTI